MREPVPFSSGSDPLHRDDPVRFTTEIPVLGIPTCFRSNSATVIDAAEESFGAWRSAGGGLEPGLREKPTVTLFVEEGEEGPGRHPPVRYRTRDGHRLLLATPGSQAVVEPLRRDALGWITTSLVRDRAHFRYSVLEAVTFALLSPMDRYPLHAAGLARAGVALLLVGPSGVGKSTLAYAAAREGIAVLSEDLVHLQLKPRLRVWGLTARVHLLDSARAHFPELAHVEATLLANGESKLSIDLDGVGARPATPVADDVRVCVLAREEGTGRPALASLTEAELAAALDFPAETGFDIFRDEIRPALGELASGGGWRLVLGPDPNAAVPHLEAMLDAPP